ncbi:hypothetical protein HH310_25195 [Actinoplanes sp. TBRC 11911]|uniref:hypothetical protein n=1 Tax=Actinoplanes sp. TBRC 11911 TaxID=2729386 RepID=UPI00145DE3BB|nr:hypothetical protein [Actinoplanes sp. TBRC 11911]NMO54468.1 hypothetical protein [Actinoplanes sp. TBRC 11911]
MFPRTRVIPLAGAVIGLLAACGVPPQPLPTSPAFTAPSTAPVASGPAYPAATLPTAVPTFTGFPTTIPPYAYPTTTVAPTTPPTTKSPTPTPSHAAKCATAPTGAQILTLIKGKPGIPTEPLRVFDGPFCSGTWSFTRVEVTGENADETDPLLVISTGSGSALTLVTAGSDVCIDRVQTEAPPGIRVLACGF